MESSMPSGMIRPTNATQGRQSFHEAACRRTTRPSTSRSACTPLSPDSLRSRIPHPCFDEALRLQTIQGGVERSDGAAASNRALNFLPHRRAVSVLAQARGRGKYQVLELAQHDYYHIVVLIVNPCQGANS